ncbi:MAG: ABC transporter substrate-binding protein [Spirochaetia bacterium]|nr:ABC transporter substrate-binding protein [Spirochaetia bacterium]
MNKKIFQLAFKENIESFDPVNCVDETSGIVLNLLHRNLYTTSVDGRLINDLAETQYSNYNSVFLTIRQGVYFNQAEKLELTAEDVVFCLNRLKESGRQPWVLDKIISIEVVGRYAVKFTLNGLADSIWNRQKYLFNLPQTAIYSKDNFLKKNIFTGASAFSITDYKPEKLQITSTSGSVLNYSIIPSEASQWFYYQRSKLDVYQADGVFQYLSNEKNTYQKKNRIEPIVIYGAIVADQNSMLNNRELRRALNFKMDRKNLAEKVLLDSCQSADYPVPDILGEPMPEMYSFDENGKCPVSNAQINANEVVQIYSPADRDRQLIARVIKNVLGECGIQSRIKVVDLPTLIKINNERKNGIYILKWIADYPHAENFLIPLFHSRNAGSGGNRSYYENAQLDYILDHQNIDSGNLAQIQNIIRQDAPWIFIGFSKKVYYVNKEKNIQLPVMYTGWNEDVFERAPDQPPSVN